MLLYSSSLEEKFKVYREQQILNLKAQEDQLMQAMIARDPALAERFIEAKSEAKPEAKPEATVKVLRQIKTQTPDWPMNETDLKKERPPPISTFDLDEKKKQSSVAGSPLYFKELEERLENRRQGQNKPISKEERQKEIEELKIQLQSVKDPVKRDEITKLLESRNNALYASESRKKKVKKLRGELPAFEEQTANGLRTKRCKVHF